MRVCVSFSIEVILKHNSISQTGEIRAEICIGINTIRASLMAQAVKKNLRAIQEIQVRPLGHEEPLNYEMATHLSILA